MKYKLLLIFFFIALQLFSQSKNQSTGFKENKGQIIDQKGKPNNAVKYLLNSGGLNVQLKKNGFSYDIYEVKKSPITPSKTSKTLPYQIPEKDKNEEQEYSLEYLYHRIDIDFVNSNPKVELVTDQKSTDFDNYYNVPNKPEGITGIYQYKQITYKNIYPNIDVVFSIPNDPKKVVEYNFVIHPNGKVSDIQLKFNGAKTDLVDNKILMNVRFGKMEETLPMSWTEDRENKQEITVRYRKIKNNVYGFETSNQVSDKTVIIDPVPTRLWGTYYGGDGEENNFNGIVKTNNQFVYIGGYTTSLTNISTSGSYQPNFISNEDGFIAKFDSDGQRIWSTYYGESHRDIFRALDFDTYNNIYAAGQTGSTNNISTSGSHQQNYNNWYDGMIVKFDSNGHRIWGTYYGGGGIDQITSIKVDHNQNIIVTGYTQSVSDIATPNSFKPTANTYVNNSGEDGFLAKFNENGVRIWATYYGGDGLDNFFSVDIDSNNNIFCSGTTSSFQGISTPGSYRETFNYKTILWNDTFVVKFNTNGERLFGTYYGGLDYDVNSQILIDKEDNFIISGYTRSTDDIGKTNSFQANNNGQYDSYLAKFTNKGNLIWSTFYGGEGFDGHWGKNSVAIDENNSIYLYSSGTSSNNISTIGSFQENLKGYSNLYIVKFRPNGERVWGTYYGGASSNYSGDISYDKNGIFYLSGWTYSSTDIATPNAFQTQLKGTYDTFLIKFKDCESTTSATSNSPICNGNSLELKASGGTNYSWTGPNGFISTDQNPTIPNATTINSGEYSCLITGTGSCDDTKKINVVVANTASPTGNTNQTFCSNQNATIANILVTGSSIKWYDAANNGTLLAETTSLQNGKTYYASQTINNCESPRFGITVSIVNTPSAPIGNTSQAFCKNQNASLNQIQISGQNIKWYDTNSSATSLPNTTLLENNKTYYASQTAGCESARTAILIKINDTSLPTGNNNQQFCIYENATFSNLNITGTNLKWYNSAVNGNNLQESILQNSVYYATQTLNNCESERYAVTVKIQDTQIPIADSPQAFCIQKNALIRDIDITGQNIKWYDSNTSSVSLTESTLLANGITYYASQIINNCESDRTPVAINILNATASDCINLIDELPYPKFFTPNNDGFNDHWTIDFAYLAPNSTIKIFDRYGKLIKELISGASWDGTYQNLPLSSTDYWFVATRLNGAEFRAHFSLKR